MQVNPCSSKQRDGYCMIKRLVEYVVASIVEKPDQVIINEKQEDNKYIISIHVDDQDVGKVIGKNGRTIKALRALVSTVRPPDVFVSIDVSK